MTTTRDHSPRTVDYGMQHHAGPVAWSDAARREIDDIFSRYPDKRSATLPVLWLAVRDFGWISPEVERIAAEVLDRPLNEMHEVATFYTMYPRQPRGTHHIQICRNISCWLAGSRDLVAHAKARLGLDVGSTTTDGQFTLSEVECLCNCEHAPTMRWNNRYVNNVTRETLDRLIDNPSHADSLPGHPSLCPSGPIVSKHLAIDDEHTLAVARRHGVYTRIEKAFAMSPDDLVQEVIKANLRGLGGAGFPTGRKWSFLPKDSPKPRYLVVNGDEGEPGTCKDKYIMIADPHLLIEGIVITCRAIGAHMAYIYIRGEYDLPIERMESAIAEAKAAGILGAKVMEHAYPLDIVVHRGAGAYICGEETALLESLEGKRGWPRLKPPFPAVEGYQRCPTVINNVETLAYVPHIIEMGAAAFAVMGTERSGGMRLISVSGRVRNPGVFEVPMTTTLRRLIYEHAGGIVDDRSLKAVIPGGSSAPVLTPDEIDVAIDFDALARAGTMAGSAGVIVFDDTVSMVEAALVIAQFYSHESCGQCTPCREGTAWIETIFRRLLDERGRTGDMDNVLRIARNIMGNTICPFGDGAAMPIAAIVRKFRREFEDWIAKGAEHPPQAIRPTYIGASAPVGAGASVPSAVQCEIGPKHTNGLAHGRTI